MGGDQYRRDTPILLSNFQLLLAALEIVLRRPRRYGTAYIRLCFVSALTKQRLPQGPYIERGARYRDTFKLEVWRRKTHICVPACQVSIRLRNDACAGKRRHNLIKKGKRPADRLPSPQPGDVGLGRDGVALGSHPHCTTPLGHRRHRRLCTTHNILFIVA